MKHLKFSENQIVNILKQAETGVSEEELSLQHGFSRATFHKWKAIVSAISISELKRLQELEDENRRLKQMYVNLSLEHDLLMDISEKKLSDLLSLSIDERKEFLSLSGDVTISGYTREIHAKQNNCGGRPQDEDYNWAFEQIYGLHRSHREVYLEWLTRRQKHANLMQLADPYESFKKAISKRRKKGKKGD